MRASAAAAWLVVGACAWLGDLVHPALRPDGGAARTTVTVGLGLAYALVLAALTLPGPRALTVVRVGVPAGTVAVALGAAASFGLVAVAGQLGGLLATIVVLQPVYAEAQVDAASYGDEHRFLLRPPGPVLVALVVPLWAVCAAGAAVGPLLLTGRGWTAGATAGAAGLGAAALAAHILYRLATRWLVFVPNGLVVHDHLAVAEPLPLGRRSIASIGPARADTAAADLPAQAFGMALALQLADPVAASGRTGRNRSEARSLTAVLSSPSRPAAVLATAERRGLKIG